MSTLQILYIHGGMTFRNREDYLKYLKTRELSIDFADHWSQAYLDEHLKSFTIVRPRMPLSESANYDDWKIHLERYLDILDDEIIMVGESLGGMFLVKYLAENNISKKVISLYIVGAPYDGSGRKYIVGGFDLPDDLSNIEKNCESINLMFSVDDPVVPFVHLDKYKRKMPSAKWYKFSDKNGHFIVNEFPEIVEMIKKDANI